MKKESKMRLVGGLLRLISGLLGLAFTLFGLLMLVFEVMVWVPDSARAANSLGQVWFQNDPFFSLTQSPSIQLAQVIIERKLNWPELWSPGITTILNWPSWIALLVIGLASIVLGSLFSRIALPGRR
jgi:hypothetical protein